MVEHEHQTDLNHHGTQAQNDGRSNRRRPLAAPCENGQDDDDQPEQKLELGLGDGEQSDRQEHPDHLGRRDGADQPSEAIRPESKQRQNQGLGERMKGKDDERHIGRHDDKHDDGGPSLVNEPIRGDAGQVQRGKPESEVHQPHALPIADAHGQAKNQGVEDGPLDRRMRIRPHPEDPVGDVAI